MNLASYYLTIVTAVILANCSTIDQAKSFYVFWRYGSNSNECNMEEQLVELLVKYPKNCFQTKLNGSEKMSIMSCVENIKCDHTNSVINYDEVAMCSTDTEMVCCLNRKQCPEYKRDQTSSECQIVGKSEKRTNKLCTFPFKYKGETHHSCTVTSDKQCLRWCPTLLGYDNQYIEKSGLWGYCDNRCPVNYNETCDTNETMIPRFEKELEKVQEKPVASKEICGTQNTTTLVKNYEGGADEEFTLLNPGSCSFPFNYRGAWYNKCIANDDPLCRLWCSVRNDNGYHRKLGSKWAYCNKGCSYKRKVCAVNGKRVMPHFYQDEFPTLDYIENDDPKFFLIMTNDYNN